MIPQRTGFGSFAVLSGLVMTLLVVNTFRPRWIRDYGLDFWNAVDSQEELQRHEAEREVIEARYNQFLRERDISGQVASRLIEGTIALSDAIDALEPILIHRVGFDCSWPDSPPPTFRHAVARYTMTRVESELATNPKQLALVSHRLKTEYAAIR